MGRGGPTDPEKLSRVLPPERPRSAEHARFEFAGATIDFDSFEVDVRGKPVRMTHLEMKLLRRKDYPGGRFTLAFVGYGEEASTAVIDCTPVAPGRPKRSGRNCSISSRCSARSIAGTDTVAAT